MSTFRCPNCDGKLGQKDYDEIYEWYECPSCENCFMFDELLEGGGEAVQDGNSHAMNGEVKEGLKRLVAKGKKRRSEIQEDEELAEEQIKAVVKKKRRADDADHRHHRDELPTGEVLNIMADEIQAIYHDLGGDIEDYNARDKALILWRSVHLKGVTAREQAVKLTPCKEHK